MRLRFCVLFLVTVLFSTVAVAQQTSTAAIPNLISFSGTISPGVSPTATDGTVAPDGRSVGVTFAIYGQQEGGAPLWLETQNVTVSASGRYSVLLGSADGKGLPLDLFSAREERWLGVKAEGQPEQARVMLVAVPYAFKAHEADSAHDAQTLGGLPPSAYMLATQSATAAATASTSAATGMPAAISPDYLRREATVGHGTKGYIPIWRSGDALGNSVLYQNYNGMLPQVGIGTNNPQATLDVVAATNQPYAIGGKPMLGIGNPGDQNVFLGEQAGLKDMVTQGKANTFAGFFAGQQNTTGTLNTFVGTGAGQSNQTANFNTYVGGYSGIFGMTGTNNTFAGYKSGYNNQSGSYNIFLGQTAGYHNQTGSSNIDIGADLPAPESNTIRIGTQGGGNGQQSATYIAGIVGQTTSGGSAVFVDANGKLGTTGGTLTQPQLCAALSGDFFAANAVGCNRIVFITDEVFNGALGDLGGANGACQNEAVHNGLPGSYKAWLSDGSGSPNSTFRQSGHPYQLLDGPHTQVAANYAGLTSGTLQAPINISASGNNVGSVNVWTATTSVGFYDVGPDCLSWSSSFVFDGGDYGNSGSASGTWTQVGTTSCVAPFHLYCFQQ